MPKLPHEALVNLVRNAPEVVFHLLRQELGLELPLNVPCRLTTAEFVDLNFAEHRADAILTLGDAGRPSEAFVVEAQSDIDPRKHRSWPIYVAGPHARLGCPVTLVVIAPDPAVAAWAATPIDLGRGRTIVRPLVIGPHQIPVITDLDEARRFPELAVLSVAAHGREPGAEHIALAAIEASRDLDNERAVHYADFALAFLGEVARKALEQLMQAGKNEYYSDFARKYFFEGQAEGEARGEAKMILRLLRNKGFTVDAAVEARVTGCKDLEQLDTWADRILTANSLDEVLAD